MIVALIVPPAAADLFVNELDSDQTGVDAAEFVEIYNSGPGAVNFGAAPHVLVFFNGGTEGTGTTSYLAVNLTGVLAADDFLVVGDFGVPNLDIDICEPPGTACDNRIQNGEDAVGLYTGTTADFPSGTTATMTNLVDALVYETGADPDTTFPTLLGTGEVLDEDEFGTAAITSISRTPDGGPFSAGQVPSPGSPNGLAPPIALPKLTTMQVGAVNVPVELCSVGGVGAITFNITVLPLHGDLTDDSGAITAPRAVSGTLRYTPDGGYSGLDTFEATATDEQPATSDPVMYELGVQLNTVAISEVMHTPSNDQRVYEYIEIYNNSTSAVPLTRLDTERDEFIDTTANLSVSIPAHSMRIITTDATSLGFSLDIFHCEWNVFEADVIRIPIAHFETMFASPDASSCDQSDGSRILLFGAGDLLLDAVDLGLVGAVSDLCSGKSYGYDASFDPLGTTTNDDIFNWACADELPGDRTGVTGDAGSPAYVPGRFTTYLYDEPCFGSCCLTDGTCAEGLTFQECLDATCQIGTDAQGRYHAGQTCLITSCPAAEPVAKCCLPIGVCQDLDECSCLLLNGNFDDTTDCASSPSCPVTVDVIINELDYDTPGTDTEEFLELFGTADASLVGWTLEFFNGNAPPASDSLYKSIDLATVPGGAIPSDGYMVVGSGSVPNVDLLFDGASNQIQNGGVGVNGNGDGIVLLFNGIAVEAISYDTGTTGFTARGGDADGVFMPDIGVLDTAAQALQKVPDAGPWRVTNNRTPGETNFDAGEVGACCRDEVCTLEFADTCTSGGVYLGDGTDCTGDPCIPRGACCLRDGSCLPDLSSNGCNALGGTWLGEDSLCPDEAIPSFVACVSGPGGGLGPDCARWDYDMDVDVDLFDFWQFQSDFEVCVADPVGACCRRDGVCEETNEFACDSIGGDYRGDGVACADLDPPCPEPVPGEVLINEVWADDPGTDDHEFIELFGSPGASLTGRSIIIVDGDTGGDTSSPNYRSVDIQIDLDGFSLDTNGFFVTGTGLGLAGLVDADLDAVFGDADGIADEIENGSQTYALVNTVDIAYCTSSGVPEAGCQGNPNELTPSSVAAITAGAIDTIATRTGVFDPVYFFAPLVQDGTFPFDYAQRIPNGTDTDSAADWQTVFGVELGDSDDPSTPGAVNQSQSSLPGACCDGTTCTLQTEADCTLAGGDFIGVGTDCSPNPCECATIAQAKALGDGQAVTICDAVISSTTDLINSPAVASFQMQDDTGGITVFGGTEDIDPLLALVGEGSQIDLAGTTDIFNGLFELASPFVLVSDDGFVGLPAATVTTAADYQAGSATAEGLESKLVTLECVEFQQSGTFAAASNYTVSPDGGATTVVVRVSTTDLDLVGTPIPVGPVTLFGIFSQFDSTSPFDSGYQLLLRSTGDLVQPCE